MDVDTGSDDAVALVMAMLDKGFDLLGICSVNGNIEVKLTTDNSLRTVECCGKQDQVKVYKGCDLPLVSTLTPWSPQSTGIQSWALINEPPRKTPAEQGIVPVIKRFTLSICPCRGRSRWFSGNSKSAESMSKTGCTP